MDAFTLDRRFADLGSLLGEAGESATILVVGGAALLLRGDADRLTTDDIDVIARVEEKDLAFPDPLPAPLAEAILVVARNYDLPEDWLNTVVARNWAHSWPDRLPPDLLTDADWRTYGGLTVGLAGRATLIPLKVHAVVDRARATAFDEELRVTEVDLSPDEARRHLRDLLALAPTDDELQAARTWVATQDGSPQLDVFLDAIDRHVRSHRR